jgi:prepilin-type N-terminal cleavage/methylation domain-containing protein
MIRRSLRKMHKGQGGFTLIEVLVVMTILGILAAIVSISLLGVTASARTKAKDAERQTVQAAFDAMLADQQVPETHVATACSSAGTYHNDMTIFPSNAAYTNPDTPLWVSGTVTQLATHYLREPITTYGYYCTATGDVVQSTDPLNKNVRQ